MVISKEKHLQNIKKYWSKEEKNNFFQAWKESKLSQSEFCRQNNLSIATFSNWVSQFKKNSKPKLLFSPIQTHKAINNPQSIKIGLPNGLQLNFPEIINVQIICELVESLIKCHP